MAIIDFTGNDGQLVSAVTPFRDYAGTPLEIDGNRAGAVNTSTNIALLDNVDPTEPFSVDIRYNTLAADTMGIMFHVSNETQGSENFALASIRGSTSPTFRLFSFINGSATLIDSQGSTISAGVNYRVTISNSGTTYTAVLRNLDTATDIATISGTITGLTQTSEVAGLRSQSNSATYDNAEFVSTGTGNVPPSVDAGNNVNVVQGQPYQLNPTVNDVEGDTLTYQWTQTTGTAGAFSDATALNPTFTPSSTLEVVTLQLSVNDGVNPSVTDTVNLNVVNSITGTPETITLNGLEHNTTFVGANFIDEGATVTYVEPENADSIVFASTTIDTSTASRQTYSYVASGLTPVTRVVNIEETLISAQANTTALDGLWSWWQEKNVSVRNGIIFVSFTDSNGFTGISEWNATTLELISYRYLETAIWPQDGHNSPAHLHLSDGRLIVFGTGHGNRTGGGNDGTYVICESSTGRIANLTNPTLYDFNFTRSNYSQLFETDSQGVWAFSNDDIGDTWTPIQRTGVDTWIDRKPVMTLGTDFNTGQQQAYADIAQAGNLLHMFCTAHPSNTSNSIRLITLDTATDNVFINNTPTPVGSIAVGNATDSAVVQLQDAPSIRQAASGRSQRLLYVAPDGLSFIVAEFDNTGVGDGDDAGNGDNGKYIYVYNTNASDLYSSSSWSEKDITTYQDDSYIWDRSYYAGGATKEADDSNELVIALARKVGSNWQLETYRAASVADSFTSSVLDSVSGGTNVIARPIITGGKIGYFKGAYTEYRIFDTDIQLINLPNSGANTAPTANAGADQTGQNSVAAGSTVTLDGSGSTDSDGTIASYTWTQTAGDTVTLSDATAASPTFTAPSTSNAQTLTFSLIVTDNDGATSTADTVDIGVLAEVQQPDDFTLNLSFTNLPDGSYDTWVLNRDSEEVLFSGARTWNSGSLALTLQGTAPTNYDYWIIDTAAQDPKPAALQRVGV